MSRPLSQSASRRTSMDSMSDDQLFPLELSVVVKGLAPSSNPIVGMFGIDAVTGGLNFLAHTELQRSTGHPRFDKKLHLNYFPGRNQKVHFNVYSAPTTDDGSDHDICEEDRVGSVIVALDKIPSLQSRMNFVPIKIELPLWHDTDMKLLAALQKQGTAILIEFHAQEGIDTGPMSGPKSEMTYLESIELMTKGANFLKYRFSSSGKPQNRFVFYEKADGPMGSLWWCDPGKRKKEKDKNIPLHTVTGLFEENQTKAFKKFFKKPDPVRLEKCFSIVAKDRTLDLEAESKAKRDAFMYGIHKVLTSQGFGIEETDKLEQARQKEIAEARRLSIPVRNTFEIRAKLRNMPILPWSNDDSTSLMIALYEKQGATFVLIEQTDWQKDNSNPNFNTPLLMPFTVPLTPSIVKIVVYDTAFDESHMVGSALVRTDTFQRYAGQEMLIKLRNHSDSQIDGDLQANNGYMLLTAVIKQGDARAQQLGPSDPNAKKGYNNLMDELKTAISGGGRGGGMGGYRSTFVKSIATFMGAGEAFALFPCTQGASIPAEISSIKAPKSINLFYRAGAAGTREHGHLIIAENKSKSSGEDDLLDEDGNPLYPLLKIPMSQLKDVLTGSHPPHFKTRPASFPDRAFTVLVKKSSTDDTLLYALDFEARSKAVRDSWSSGITDFIAFVEEELEAEGGDDDKLKFLDEAKGKKTALDAAKKNALQADSNILGEAGEKFGDDDKKLKKGTFAAADSDSDDDMTVRHRKKSAAPLEAPVIGDGDVPPPPPMDVFIGDGVPPPPPMFDMVFGPDGVPLAPPPPGPPGAPGFSVAGPPAWTGPKLKRLHWEALDGINVDGTLWGLVQGDLEEEAGAMLEQLFKIADAKKKAAGEDEPKDKIKRLYDGKRAQNIEILIKSFRMPPEAIQEAIRSMDMSILTQERLQILLTCCPTVEESMSLKAYKKKNPDLENVGQAEMFGYALLEIPKVTMRLRLLLFQTKFDGLVKDMIDTYQRLLTGANVLHDSEKLKKVMQVVLSVGNYLNASTRKKAKGFRLTALEKLNDTKSHDNKQTLLDFIVDYMDRIRAKEEESGSGDDEKEEKKMPPPASKGEKEPPPSYLADLATAVHDASLIDWAALNSERENLLTGLNELDKEMQAMNKDETIDENDQFRIVMEEFLGHAQRRVGKLKKKYAQVAEETDALIEYFGESSSTMETTELFKIFDRFFNMYKAAEVNQFNKRENEARKERLAKAREEADRAKAERARAKGETPQDGQDQGTDTGFGVKLKPRASVNQTNSTADVPLDAAIADAIAGKTRFGTPLKSSAARDAAAPASGEQNGDVSATFGVKLKPKAAVEAVPAGTGEQGEPGETGEP